MFCQRLYSEALIYLRTISHSPHPSRFRPKRRSVTILLPRQLLFIPVNLSKMTSPVKADDIITEIGGCGRFQWRLNIIVHMINTIVCFSMNSITIFSATPSWTCADDESCDYTINDNGTETFIPCPEKACFHINSTRACKKFLFDDEVRNMVTEVINYFQLYVFKHHIRCVSFSSLGSLYTSSIPNNTVNYYTVNTFTMC